jgi:hypothetical protein
MSPLSRQKGHQSSVLTHFEKVSHNVLASPTHTYPGHILAIATTLAKSDSSLKNFNGCSAAR